jgi:acyl carrier protein
MSQVFTKDAIAEFILGKVCAQARVDKHTVDLKAPLDTYGLDSVYGLGLSAELEDWLGIHVDPTLAWDYPSIDQMAGFLEQEAAAHAHC